MVTAPWPPASDLKTFFSEDSSTYPTKQNFNVESAEAGSSSIDVTRVVQAWASGETPNYGFVFRETNPNVDTTRTHACYQFFDARPVLSIEAY